LVGCSSTSEPSPAASTVKSASPATVASASSTPIARAPDPLGDQPHLTPRLAASGDAAQVGGIPLEKATPENVRAAIMSAGCAAREVPGVGHGFEAICTGHEYFVTFVATGDPAPDPLKLDAVQRNATTARSGTASLAVQPRNGSTAKDADAFLAALGNAKL
jgi:hypothetical protein